MLCIDPPSHRPDEDLLERWFHQFKPVDLGYPRSLGEKLLRIAVRLEPNLGVSGEVLSFGNLGRLQKLRAAFKLNDDMVALVARLDFPNPSRENGFPVVDQTDRVAELLDLIHPMG